MTRKQLQLLKNFNTLHDALKSDTENNFRIPDDDIVSIIRWLVIHEFTDIQTMEDLCTTYDNANNCNIEILNGDNLDNFADDVLLVDTSHRRGYLAHLLSDKKIGYLLHWPRVFNGRCFIEAKTIKYNLHDLNHTPKKAQPRFVVLGCKYRDVPNGNTYCNAKIYDTKTGVTHYAGYTYGYDSYYLYHARQFIVKNIIKKDIDAHDVAVVDFGCIYVTKKSDCKYNNF